MITSVGASDGTVRATTAVVFQYMFHSYLFNPNCQYHPEYSIILKEKPQKTLVIIFLHNTLRLSLFVNHGEDYFFLYFTIF